MMQVGVLASFITYIAQTWLTNNRLLDFKNLVTHTILNSLQNGNITSLTP